MSILAFSTFFLLLSGELASEHRGHHGLTVKSLEKGVRIKKEGVETIVMYQLWLSEGLLGIEPGLE